MPIERFYFKGPLILDEVIPLEGSEFHHLIHVMRMKEGEEVELVNGEGILTQAFVHHLKKNQALLKIVKLSSETPLPFKLILAQAFPKPNRLDFILEKGTELGVDAFWFFPGEKSAKKELSLSQIERAQLLTIAAMKQCGRLTLPSIKICPFLTQWKSFPSSSFFGDLSEKAPLLASFEPFFCSQKTALFVIGPESGFTEKEINFLKEAGVHGVKLHRHVLRTDTASIMALSLLSHYMLKSK